MTRIAMSGAALMLAHQVAGKAVRDSLFLSHYPSTALPKIVMAAAVVSILFVLASGRLMARFGPSKIIPAGFLLSSLLHIIEYVRIQAAPTYWSVVVYIHIAALGAILLSGFWSLMSESFDPRAAKQVFGKVTGFGTLGGICGGLMAERLATIAPYESTLLLLAVFHLLCAGVLAFARRNILPRTPEQTSERLMPTALFRRAPYLRWLALTVLTGTSAAAIVDYLFKAGAKATFGEGTELLRLFAFFYIFTQICTFLVQTFLAKKALMRLGIGRSISSLPLGLGAGSLAALLIPVFPAFALVRSLEFVLRSSLFRSAYELFFTPVPPAEKRAAKTLIDVAFDRAGDALGGGLVQLMLWIGNAFIVSELLGITLAISVIGVLISRRLDNAYTRLVQQRLIDGAVEFDLAEIPDQTSRSVMISAFPATQDAPGATIRPTPEPTVARSTIHSPDPTLHILSELRSGNRARVLAALSELDQVSPLIASQLLRLLAWNEVSDPVRKLLQRRPQPITGLLVDHLINPSTLFGIRRRIPPILAHSDSSLAVLGLLAGLEDSRFEVRFQCSRALDTLHLHHPELKIQSEVVFAAVERELAVAQPIWSSRRLLDKRNEPDQEAFLDEVLRERADQSLEHVFSLFAAVLPREPVKIAFRAFHTDVASLRGLAMEYLDSVLPAPVRARLWVLMEPKSVRPSPDAESGQEALNKLLQSHESLLIQIDKNR